MNSTNIIFNRFLETFREYFLLFMNVNSERRKFDLLPYNTDGYFSRFVEKNENFTFNCYYDLKRIEIYYKEEVIDSNFISNRNFHLDDRELSKIARYLATHEYGHTFFCESTYTSKILFERKFSLPNNYNFIFLAVLFNEFTAEWQAYKMIPKLPETYLSMYLDLIERLLQDFFVYRVGYRLPSVPTGLEHFDYCKDIFKDLIRLFVYHQWSKVESLFNSFYLKSMESYWKKLFQIFEHLYCHTIREDLVLRSLKKLAPVLSQFTLWDLISGKTRLEQLEVLNIDNLNFLPEF